MFCSNSKLSIDIIIMSVREIFTKFRFIFVKRSCSKLERQAHPISFLFVFKALCFLDIVSAQKSPLYSYFIKKKLYSSELCTIPTLPYFICFHCCPEARFSFNSPHKRLDMRLAHIYLG